MANYHKQSNAKHFARIAANNAACGHTKYAAFSSKRSRCKQRECEKAGDVTCRPITSTLIAKYS